MSTPAFIVGTGRCGSTLLSNMVNSHPDILSLSEFFTFGVDLGGRIEQMFVGDKITGKAFWAMLSTPMPRETCMIKNRVVMPEVLYPVENLTEAQREAGIASILQVTLPHITENYEALFVELGDKLNHDEPKTIRDHYDELFTFLMAKYDKKCWVERSGASFVYIDKIMQTFPDAKFVHIVRDGRDTALSMSVHLGFKMFLLATQITQILGFDPFEQTERCRDGLPDELKAFLPESFNVEAFLNLQIPIEQCGALWSEQIVGGTRALSLLPPENVLTIHYEQLVRKTDVELKKLLSFLDLEQDDGWIARCAGLIAKPSSQWQSLPQAEQDKLNAACKAGFDCLDAQ